MDDHQFDSLVKSFDGTRRGVLRAIGAGALTAIATPFALAENAAAKKHRTKKKKKCKAGTRACNGGCIPQNTCCVDTDCQQNQTCTGGQCVAVNAPPQCRNDGDCGAGQVCQNGQCVAKNTPECQIDTDCQAGVCQNGQCVVVVGCQNNNDCGANEICLTQTCQCKFPSKPCGAVCCASDEACVNGACVVGQGTCAAGQSVCDEHTVACNGDASCTCADRLDDGEPRCIQFVDDSRTGCNCGNDFQSGAEFGPGTICIKGGDSCECPLTTLGRCARLCPGSN